MEETTQQNNSKVLAKLLSIQTKLKAPKNQVNNFGKYKYRNCEDILEATKPLLDKNKCTLLLTDTIVNIGERYYVQATAKFVDIESLQEVQTTAFAREELEKKGMDSSQVTGASSSYARKYALNGLFLIDDTKDSDATNDGKKSPQKSTNEPAINRSAPTNVVADMNPYFTKISNLSDINGITALEQEITTSSLTGAQKYVLKKQLSDKAELIKKTVNN